MHPSEERAEAPAVQASSRLANDLKRITHDGLAYSLMVGLGETYVAAFALALGHPQVLAGLVTTVPVLAGALVQLAAPSGLRRIGSHRRWVIGCVVVQALCFAPLTAAALLGWMPAWSLFAVAGAYWAAGFAGGPAWNTWTAALVPARVRARYFARRAHLLQAGTAVGLLAGGGVLQTAAGDASAERCWPFAVLFGAALVFRLVSARELSQQSEPSPMPVVERRVPLPELLRRLRSGQDGRLLVYLFLVQAAAQLAAPYFTPFMLRGLSLSYGSYVGLLGCAFGARILSTPLWGEFAHRHGAARLLWIGGVGIVPTAALWLVSDNYAWLLVAQAFAGCAWAAYELGFFLLFFEAIRDEERTQVLTLYNLTNSLGMVIGSLVGGWLLAHLGADLEDYLVLFAISSVARALPLGLLKHITGGKMHHFQQLALRVLAVRPGDGSVELPILFFLPRPGRKKKRRRRR